jgi:hypothetical protein
MATDKKSFLLYCDIIHTINKLSDEQSGILFKHILAYVNDQYPVTDDVIIELVFEPIKQGLKRDLQKYLNICERNKKNGEKGGRPEKKPKKPSRIITNPKNPDEPKKPDSDIDSDIDSDSEKGKLNKFNFKKSLLFLGVSEKIVSDWLIVRKNKKASNTETAFDLVKLQIELSGLTANECIKIASENSWSGFKAKWLENLNNTQNGQTFNNNSKSKLAGTYKAAENLAREIEEKNRNFVSPLHRS